jgi:hypothetical protein
MIKSKSIFSCNSSDNQGNNSMSIGNGAGENYQSNYCIALGYKAGYNYQKSNLIILNAGNLELNANNEGLFVNPIRTSTQTNNILVYDTTTKEIQYNTSSFRNTGYTGPIGSQGISAYILQK